MKQSTSPVVSLARNKKLTHPTERKPFNAEQWLDAYKKHSNGNPVDKSLCEGAGWLATHFSRVRATRDYYKLHAGDSISGKELLHAHLAGANLSFALLAKKQMRDLPPEAVPTMEKLLDYKTDLTLSGVEVNVNQLNMFRLDSLCSPIYEVLHERIDLSVSVHGNAEPSSGLPKLDFMVNEFRCSQLYHNGVVIWQQLLYGDAIFAYDLQRNRILMSQLNDIGKMKAICDYRREHHHAAMALETQGVAHNLLLWLGLNYPRKVLKSDGLSGVSIVTADDLGDDADRFIKYKWAEPYFVVEPHLFELLKIQCSKSVEGQGYSVRDVLVVWFHLAMLARQSVQASTEENPGSWGQLLQHCTWFDRKGLVVALSIVTEMSEQSIGAIIGFMTFEAKERQDDLWTKPILQVGGEVTFSVSALLSANLRRNVDAWIRLVDPKSHLRGKHFEKYLENVMEECRSANKVMRSNLSWTGSVMLKYDGEQDGEEIDLTFSFGNTLVIAELRSRRTPITPLDYHNALYEEGGIFTKVEQAERKTAYVRKHLARFCRDYYPRLSENIDAVMVYPLVIVNDQFHAGFPCGDTPVLDEHLLKHFLKDGMAKFFGSHDHSNYRFGIVLYENIEEAERSFFSYAMRPTIIEVYQASVYQKSTLYSLMPGEPGINWLSYEVKEASSEKQLRILKNVSIGKFVQRY
ncbi:MULTISPECIES: hypothetical protein [Pseudomonas syringae group]|nr:MULTISPECIES: hypothetical protein [Pseudomonas syringae group]EEB61026.1 hypothetical protein PSPTOT1_1619 [Pseudomonas syringae pv. tomato T1]MDT3235667.1 hypothetical protein [Pseudomonas syringae pv. tomato]RMQ78218.1 hypothetical protein ALP99_04130 [Pseudomonas syringae pv. tomato]RMQ78395.1 hypothetical protein ALQ00_03202 [Pseudomonas syringae pv. tomato]